MDGSARCWRPPAPPPSAPTGCCTPPGTAGASPRSAAGTRQRSLMPCRAVPGNCSACSGDGHGHRGREAYPARPHGPRPDRYLLRHPGWPSHGHDVGDLVAVTADTAVMIYESLADQAPRILPVSDHATGSAFSASGHRLYVAREASTLLQFDRFTWKPLARIDLPGQPAELRTDPFGQWLLVRPAQGDSVWVVDLSRTGTWHHGRRPGVTTSLRLPVAMCCCCARVETSWRSTSARRRSLKAAVSGVVGPISGYHFPGARGPRCPPPGRTPRPWRRQLRRPPRGVCISR